MQLARKLVLVAIFVGVMVFGWRFAADHSSAVVIRNPVSGDLEVSLWMALIASFGLGVVLTGSLAAVKLARQGLLSRRYRKVIRGLESEVHQLRSLPLSSDEAPAVGDPAAGETPEAERALGRGA